MHRRRISMDTLEEEPTSSSYSTRHAGRTASATIIEEDWDSRRISVIPPLPPIPREYTGAKVARPVQRSDPTKPSRPKGSLARTDSTFLIGPHKLYSPPTTEDSPVTASAGDLSQPSPQPIGARFFPFDPPTRLPVLSGGQPRRIPISVSTGDIATSRWPANRSPSRIPTRAGIRIRSEEIPRSAHGVLRSSAYSPRKSSSFGSTNENMNPRLDTTLVDKMSPMKPGRTPSTSKISVAKRDPIPEVAPPTDWGIGGKPRLINYGALQKLDKALHVEDNRWLVLDRASMRDKSHMAASSSMSTINTDDFDVSDSDFETSSIYQHSSMADLPADVSTTFTHGELRSASFKLRGTPAYPLEDAHGSLNKTDGSFKPKPRNHSNYYRSKSQNLSRQFSQSRPEAVFAYPTSYKNPKINTNSPDCGMTSTQGPVTVQDFAPSDGSTSPWSCKESLMSLEPDISDVDIAHPSQQTLRKECSYSSPDGTFVGPAQLNMPLHSEQALRNPLEGASLQKSTNRANQGKRPRETAFEKDCEEGSSTNSPKKVKPKSKSLPKDYALGVPAFSFDSNGYNFESSPKKTIPPSKSHGLLRPISPGKVQSNPRKSSAIGNIISNISASFSKSSFKRFHDAPSKSSLQGNPTIAIDEQAVGAIPQSLSIDDRKVYQAQPIQYWCGRLQAQSDALQRIDMNNALRDKSKFAAIQSNKGISRSQSLNPGTMTRVPTDPYEPNTMGVEQLKREEEKRVKRAFQALASLSITDEAKASLRDFQLIYARAMKKPKLLPPGEQMTGEKDREGWVGRFGRAVGGNGTGNGRVNSRLFGGRVFCRRERDA